ncbi:MAG: hypothetical protein ACRCZF_27085 [Gemmataceae bacterium]
MLQEEIVPVVPAAPAPKAAPGRDAKSVFQSSEFLWSVGALVALLLVGAVVLTIMDRWRRQANRTGLSTTLQLSDYREMYENGELTLSEYEKIRDKMAMQIKQEGKPVESAKGPPPPPEEPRQAE